MRASSSSKTPNVALWAAHTVWMHTHMYSRVYMDILREKILKATEVIWGLRGLFYFRAEQELQSYIKLFLKSYSETVKTYNIGRFLNWHLV